MWGAWEECSVECGGGQRFRSRACVPPLHDGLECVGDDKEEQPCGLDPCPVDGVLTPWGAWGKCSVTCEEGSQSRSRLCMEPKYGGAECDGDLTQQQTCTMEVCPVDGVLSTWSEWGLCSTTCGDGTHTRQRTCTPPIGEGADCQGSLEQEETCKDKECPVDGTWSEWSSWDTCTKECAKGEQSRTRSCHGVAHGGKPCEGDDQETQDCNTDPCPIDGIWKQWGEWGDCVVSSGDCGVGTERRDRGCTGPFYNGLDCVGPGSQDKPCEISCSIPGEWMEWDSWGLCSATCAGGTRIRTRECDMNTHGDKTSECEGDDSMSEPCHEYSCTPYGTSCQEWVNRGLEDSVPVQIDPMQYSPFWVKCNLDEMEGVAITEVVHTQMERTHVQGYESSGEYVMSITYNITEQSIEELTMVVGHCRQFIKWECKSASIKNTVTADVAMTFWANKYYENRFYWGGADPNTELCACGMTDSCAEPGTACNCDANDDVLREDSGYISNMDDVPIMQFMAGDTGSVPEEEGFVTIGPLQCYGQPGDM